jgi:hypothetical protein
VKIFRGLAGEVTDIVFSVFFCLKWAGSAVKPGQKKRTAFGVTDLSVFPIFRFPGVAR